MNIKPNGYSTKQRQLILECLKKNTSNHLTVDEIVSELKKDGVSVGVATIYRYLDKLINTGELRKYVVDDGTGAYYEYINNAETCSEHFHLKCTKCGKLLHLTCNHLNVAYEHTLKNHKFKIDNTKTILYGQCENCSK